MDESPAKMPSAEAGEETVPPDVRVYSLPEHRLPKYPKRKKTRQQIQVAVGSDYIETRYSGALLLGEDILPQPTVRVKREQITAIRETRDGLVIATYSNPQALIIPIQPGDANYREIAEELSAWRPITPKPVAGESKISQAHRQLADRIQLAKRKPLFYDSCGRDLFILSFVSFLAGGLLLLSIIQRWDEAPRFSTSPVWASGLVLLYFAIMVGSYGIPRIAFGWLDYGLAHIGIGKPTRSAIWSGVATVAVIGGVVVWAELALVMSLILLIVGVFVGAGLAWRATLLALELVVYDATQQGLALSEVATGTESDGQILGAYRFTFEELFLSFGYCIKGLGAGGRVSRSIIGLWLPQSVNPRKVRETMFSSHPYQNKIMHIAIDPDAITWKVEGLSERSLSWEMVKKVVRTPHGFLIYWVGQAYDWLPLHAFFTKDGPEALIELAWSRTEYSEID